MKIFKFNANVNDYANLHSGFDPNTSKVIRRFVQQSMVGTSIEVTIVEKHKPLPDIFQLTHNIPVLTTAALSYLDPVIPSEAERIPLSCTELDLIALNVSSRLPALDELNSDLRRNSRGEVMAIRKGVFLEEVIRESNLFSLAATTAVYYTEAFLAACNASGLHGLNPIQVGSLR